MVYIGGIKFRESGDLSFALFGFRVGLGRSRPVWPAHFLSTGNKLDNILYLLGYTIYVHPSVI